MTSKSTARCRDSSELMRLKTSCATGSLTSSVMNLMSAPSSATSSMGMTVPRIDSDMPSENLSSQVITSCTLTLGGGTSSFSSMPQRRIRASSALACFCSSAWKCS